MMSGSPDRLLTVHDVAHRLAVPVSWVYAAAEQGRLPSLRIGRYVRFRPDEIEQYIEGQRRGVDR
jgi:excisionase family DNA binding protein